MSHAPPAPPHPLLDDGSLAVSATDGVRGLVEPWLPRVPGRAARAGAAAAVIEVERGTPEPPPPGEAPAMELCGVQGWTRGGHVVLAEPGGRVGARVELEAGRARVRMAAGSGAPGDVLVSATLTMSAALLLTRLHRALLHAAAVVAPDGGAWLLAGGSFSGKTSTCIGLIRGGWDWLSDDQVVLGAGPEGEVHAEGWPRRFNLDRGFAEGDSHGVRSRVDFEEFGPGRWRSSAPVAGLLFPRVEAELPTALAPLHPAGALALVLRNTPWLLADAGAAAPVLALLGEAARLPAFELRLGRDSYCNPQRLQKMLEPALAARFVRLHSPAPGNTGSET